MAVSFAYLVRPVPVVFRVAPEHGVALQIRGVFGRNPCDFEGLIGIRDFCERSRLNVLH